MNTANLQLEGIYAVMAVLIDVMRKKGLLDGEDTDQVLDGVKRFKVRGLRIVARWRHAE